MNRFLYWMAFAAAIILQSCPAAGHTITGTVVFRDSTLTAGKYVMVYSPSSGAGTLTDESGRYSIKVPDRGSARLEYAIMGYRTEYRTVPLSGRGVTEVDTVCLDIQPIMLAAAYLTPDGEAPSKYILSQVWKTADRNRRRLAGYDASITYNIASSGIPEVASILSGFKTFLLKMAAGRLGYGPLLKHVISKDEFSAAAALERSVKGSRTVDSGKRILESNEKLPREVKENILSLFDEVNLYEMLYGEKNEWGRKFSSSHTFELTGTYEYGDKLVDILSWQDSHSGVRATVHVIEDDWGLLKIEIGRGGEVISCEARDVGGGIYMPVCFIVKPELMLIRAEEIPELIYDLEHNRRLDRQMTRRTVEVLRRHEGEDYNPYITIGYNVEYRKISLK